MIEKLRGAINEVFIGKEQVVDDVLTCLIGQGHVLLEDVPGVGKTTLARALAASVGCTFGRIQFTPDTMPTDVVGVSVFNMKTGTFEYREGAIMKQVILADEINRTSPKTQSALLEAMAEGAVTVDGVRHPLPQPFMVIATQNPIEFLGTYPLPEAQLDRFMMRLSIGYPDRANEIRLARSFTEGSSVEKITSVCQDSDLLSLQKQAAAVHVSDAILSYIHTIIEKTREEERFVLGASPRAMLFMVSACRAKAFLNQRDYVIPDDVKAIAIQVLHHRLQLTTEARIRNEDTDAILRGILTGVPVPRNAS